MKAKFELVIDADTLVDDLSNECDLFPNTYSYTVTEVIFNKRGHTVRIKMESNE